MAVISISEAEAAPFTASAAGLAGKIDAERRTAGQSIPIADLMIGATALDLGCSLLTVNVRHFPMIPALVVLSF